MGLHQGNISSCSDSSRDVGTADGSTEMSHYHLQVRGDKVIWLSDTGTGCPARWVMPQYLSVFKRHLDNALINLIWLLDSPEGVRQLD